MKSYPEKKFGDWTRSQAVEKAAARSAPAKRPSRGDLSANARTALACQADCAGALPWAPDRGCIRRMTQINGLTATSSCPANTPVHTAFAKWRPEDLLCGVIHGTVPMKK